MTGRAHSICDVGATLGEGPIWVARESALYFVDIKAPRVYRYDPATATLEHWDAPGQVGWIVPIAGGGFLTGVQDGLYRFDSASGAFEKLCDAEPEKPGNRMNDAAVDPAGRLWFGSMDDSEESATGHLYSFTNGVIRDSGADPVIITNGPAIAPDGKTLYAVDTADRRVDAYTITAEGTLTEKRPFLVLDDSVQGHPDGAICDSEGGIWLGFFGGAAVRRYAPDGQCTQTVEFPASNVTKIALGGTDGRDAYATTARKGLSKEQLAEQPEAGNLFTFRVNVPGISGTELKFDK